MRTLQRRFALIRRYVLGALLLVPLFFAQGTQPQAAMVQTDVLGATGILGLSVGSETFDIVFIDGTYDDVFPAGDLFSNAASIVDAINIELNAAGRPFISTVGPGGAFFTNLFRIPILESDAGAISHVTGSCNSIFPPTQCDFPYVTSPITESNVTTTWAVVPSPVPLPAALPLFGSALAMLGIVGWRRKRRGDA